LSLDWFKKGLIFLKFNHSHFFEQVEQLKSRKSLSLGFGESISKLAIYIREGESMNTRELVNDLY